MDLSELSKLMKIQLAHILMSVPESKDLVLDPDLTKPLDRVTGISFLKEHGVDKIFKIEPGQKSLPGCGKRIYLVRPNMVTMKYIADQINNEIAQGEKRSYKIVMVPRKIHVCETILEHEGVMGYVTLDEFPMELIPLDSDILSLELPEFFKTFYLDGDTSWLHTVSSSLVNIQRLFGRIPNVYCFGKGSKMVYDLMNTMFETHRDSKQSKYNIGQLFLIDRDVDYVSPMCSPMTYEALLDETFGIECGMIDFGAEITGDSKSTKLLLTNQDEIYGQIRGRHFSHVFSYLSGKAKELQAIYAKKNSLKTVGDMKDYVSNELRVLKHQQKLLSTHIGACEHIMKTKGKTDFEEYIKTEQNLLEGTDVKQNTQYIEECIHKQFSMGLTLRLLCLLSLTQEGLNGRDFKALKTQFIHSHGFEHLVTFSKLKQLGLFKEQESSTQPTIAKTTLLSTSAKKSNHKALNKRFNLIPKVEEVDLKNPNDLSYVFSGAYTPLPCKLVEQVLTLDHLLSLEDAGKWVGGMFSDVKVKSRGIGKPGSGPIDPALKVIVVYFLGGCTFSEITALRFLAKFHGLKILIATTSIITADSLLNEIIEKMPR